LGDKSGEVQLEILSITGMMLGTEQFNPKEKLEIELYGSDGVYLLDILGDSIERKILKIIKKTISRTISTLIDLMKKYLLIICCVLSYLTSFAQIEFLQTDVTKEFDIHSKNTHGVDIDSDGDIDLLFSGEKIYWMENLGEYQYSDPIVIDYNTPAVRDFAYGDVDNDGDIDISCIEYYGNVKWFENDGNEFFTYHEIYTTLGVQHGLLMVDLDSDGSTDFIAYNNENVYWYKNNGNQGFAEIELFDQIQGVSDIQIGDLNNDSHLDLIIPKGGTTDNIKIYTNDGSENFSVSELDSSFTNNGEVVLVDIDLDNDLDIIYPGKDSTVVICYNDSLGNFSSESVSIEGTYLTDLVTSDIDTDGDIDIVGSRLGGSSTSKLAILKNDGFQNFTSTVSPSIFKQIWDLHIADIDNDFDPDLIIQNLGDSDLHCFENDGNGNFDPINIIGYAKNIRKAAPADMDGDGDLDLVTGDRHTKVVQWHENLGDYKFKHHPLFYRGITGELRSLFGSIPVDLDGDTHMDIITHANNLIWLKNDGNESFSVHNIGSAINSFDVPTASVEDIDLDGDLDIIVPIQNPYFVNTIVCYRNDGNENFTVDTLLTTNNNFQSLKVVDFDLDGDFDLYNGKFLWLENDGNEGFTYNQIDTIISNSYNFNPVDFDKDGDFDIVGTYNPLNITDVLWYENDGMMSFEEHDLFSISAGNREVVVNDINNDGDLDLVVSNWNSASSGWYENDGNQNFSHQFIENSINQLKFITARDFDLDGDVDFISGEGGVGSISIFENSLLGDYLNVQVEPFVDINLNGIYDSLDITYYQPMIEVQPLAILHQNLDSTSSVYLDSIGEYSFTLMMDTAIWGAVDSLYRNVIVDSIQHTDTTIYIGIYPLHDLKIESDVIGSLPICGDSILHTILVRNLGSRIDSGRIVYSLSDSVTYLGSSPLPDTIIGRSLYYKFTNFNSSELIEIKVQVVLPDHIDSLDHSLMVYIDTSVLIGVDSLGFTEIVQCENQPFNKQVVPYIGEEGYILAENELEYTIRFQNPGYYIIQNIEVIDTLDIGLDISSFTMVAQSHEGQVSVDLYSREVSFKFDAINLLPAYGSEIESHGFIKYKVNTSDDVVMGDSILNTGYFNLDGNGAILSNTTQNRIFDCDEMKNSYSIGIDSIGIEVIMTDVYLTNSVWTLNNDTIHSGLDGFIYLAYDNEILNLNVKLENELCSYDTTYAIDFYGVHVGESKFVAYPNPTTGKLGVYFGKEYAHVQIKLSTLTGQLIQEYAIYSSDSYEMNLNITAGLYLLEIIDDAGFTHSIKIVKQ